MKVTILSMIISNVTTPPERAASFKAALRNSFSSNESAYTWETNELPKGVSAQMTFDTPSSFRYHLPFFPPAGGL